MDLQINGMPTILEMTLDGVNSDVRLVGKRLLVKAIDVLEKNGMGVKPNSEMSKLVDEFQCGWKVAPDLKAVISLIGSLTEEEVAEKKRNTTKARIAFSWETEKEKLIRIYQDLISEAQV